VKAQFVRSEVGLLPADSASREWFSKLKVGARVEGTFVEPRNPAFHRKVFALLNLGFEYWSETAKPLEYKGEPVLPDFERFRKDITVMAGFYKAVVNLKGEVRLEPESLAFGSMSQERFEQLYNALIQTLVRLVYKNDARWPESAIRATVDSIVEFH
jgi:hypothetical protein